MVLRFEWDENKDRKNILDRDISFQEASTVFEDLNSITIYDPLHSENEARFIILGVSYLGKLLVVVHTIRGSNLRIISARSSNRKERKTYEENI